MKALRIQEWGALDRLTVDEVPTPRPGPGEALVEIAYAGVNFMDVYTIHGAYKNSKTYPMTLPVGTGVEGAGVVEVGPGVDDVEPGDRVSYCLHWGAHAEFAVVPSKKLVPVPHAIPLDVAAAVTFQGCTAHYLAHSMGAPTAGQWALVYAGAGGVTQLLIQMLVARNVRVVATASSPAKAEVARRCGAELMLAPDAADFVEAVRAATGGGGVDVVFDSSGKETLAQSIASLRPRSLLVLVGTNSGPVASLDIAAFAEAGSLFFTRPRLADYIATPEELRGRMADIFAQIARGQMRVGIEGVFELADAVRPLAALAERRAIGKSVLRISGRDA